MPTTATVVAPAVAAPAIVLSPDPILRRVHACVLVAVAVFLWGKPGVGKTERVHAYARATARHEERWLLSRCEPMDIKPRVYTDGRVSVCDPPEIERVSAAIVQGRRAVLFTDEVNLASRETEGAILDKIDSIQAGVAIIAAGNPPTRGQNARSLGSPAANRFCHLDVVVDPEMWARAQVLGWPANASHFPELDTAAYGAALMRSKTLSAEYIKRNPKLLEEEPSDPVKAGRAWPSPRSWEFAQKLYAVSDVLGLPAEDRLALVAGCIGEGAAQSFLAYCLEFDLIDPEAWLVDPKGHTPNRIDKAVAALTAVGHSLKTNLDDTRWCAGWKILEHMQDVNMMDASMLGGNLLSKIYKDLTEGSDADKAKVSTLTRPHLLMTDRMAKLMVG